MPCCRAINHGLNMRRAAAVGINWCLHRPARQNNHICSEAKPGSLVDAKRLGCNRPHTADQSHWTGRSRGDQSSRHRNDLIRYHFLKLTGFLISLNADITTERYAFRTQDARGAAVSRPIRLCSATPACASYSCDDNIGRRGYDSCLVYHHNLTGKCTV